jgi:hypothetical protein
MSDTTTAVLEDVDLSEELVRTSAALLPALPATQQRAISWHRGSGRSLSLLLSLVLPLPRAGRTRRGS